MRGGRDHAHAGCSVRTVDELGYDGVPLLLQLGVGYKRDVDLPGCRRGAPTDVVAKLQVHHNSAVVLVCGGGVEHGLEVIRGRQRHRDLRSRCGCQRRQRCRDPGAPGVVAEDALLTVRGVHVGRDMQASAGRGRRQSDVESRCKIEIDSPADACLAEDTTGQQSLRDLYLTFEARQIRRRTCRAR